MFIVVRSLFPNVGWHARLSYSDDYSKRVLGSDQHCCRKPTYYEPCKRKRNVFLLQPAARVSFRSCCGSVLLDGSFWPCGLCLLLRVGSASGFPEACLQVLSPSATTRQAPWSGKKCAYLWRAPPRARPRDVGSWQQEASVNHGFLMGCFNRTRRRPFFSGRHPSCVAGTLTPQACHRHFQGSNSKPIRKLFWVPCLFVFFFFSCLACLAALAALLRARRSALSLSFSNPSLWACSTHA